MRPRRARAVLNARRASQVPSRAMAGVKTAMMSSTKGLAVMTTTFAGYRPHAGEFDRREKGNLLSHELGQVTGYGIARAQERGVLFAGPGDDVYENQIIGISARPGDLKVNICRKKQLTNMRSAGNDDFVNIVRCPPCLRHIGTPCADGWRIA